MNRTRIVLLGLLAVLLAVWVSSASLPTAPANHGAAVRAAKTAADQPPTPLFDLEAVTKRLTSRRTHAPAPRPPGRNPFEFGGTAPRALTTASAAASPASLASALDAAPPRPLFTLAGIVERTEAQGKVRTAVLSGLGQVFFGKPGDTVAARYEVLAVGADAVELRDTVTSETFRLALR